jgi:5,8-dihydroxy-2-naphthoate synthase
MFYAMAENKIDLRGYRFHHRLEDIQTLNERARRGELHISAISIHAYAYVAKNYALLPCGASIGDGYGPILVKKHSTRLRQGYGAAGAQFRIFLRAQRALECGGLTPLLTVLRRMKMSMLASRCAVAGLPCRAR